MIFGYTPFDGLSINLIIIVLAINWFGYTLRGAFGFGAGLPIVLFMSLIIPPHQAVVLVLADINDRYLHTTSRDKSGN